MASHRHLLEPFASIDRQVHDSLLIKDVNGAECPSVHLEGLPVELRRVSVAVVVGIRLDYRGSGHIFSDKFPHPCPGNDVGAMFLTGVQLDSDAAGDVPADLLISLDQALGRQVAGEIYDGLIAGPLVVRCNHFNIQFYEYQKLPPPIKPLMREFSGISLSETGTK